MYTVLCAFDDRDTALRSITRMIRAGLPRDDIHVQPDHGDYLEFEPVPPPADVPRGLAHRFLRRCRRLAGSGIPPGDPGTYRDAVRSGSTVIVIHVATADEAIEAASLMSDLGAFDVEHRHTRWRRLSTAAASRPAVSRQ